MILIDLLTLPIYIFIKLSIALTIGLGLFILVVIGGIIKLMFTEYKSVNQEYNNMKQQCKIIQMNVDPAEGIEDSESMKKDSNRDHYAVNGFL